MAQGSLGVAAHQSAPLQCIQLSWRSLLARYGIRIELKGRISNTLGVQTCSCVLLLLLLLFQQQLWMHTKQCASGPNDCLPLPHHRIHNISTFSCQGNNRILHHC